jgi:hypothetical protein
MRQPNRNSVSVWVRRTGAAGGTGGAAKGQRIRTVLAGLMLAVTVTTVLAVAFVIGSIIAIIISILFIGAVAAALVLAVFKRSARLRP